MGQPVPPPSDNAGPAGGPATPGASCPAHAPASLRLVASTGSANDPCRQWAELARGRVGRGQVGSFAVWTKRTPSALPLVVGALHTLGRGAAAPNGTAAAERLGPVEEEGVLRLRVVPASGAVGPMERAVAFRLFRPAVPASENTHPFAALLPRHDFYVDLTDAQRYPADDVNEPFPDSLQRGTPVPLYDPTGLASASPTFGSPKAGDMVAYAGFPASGPLAADGAIGFGAVLSDADATNAITSLAAAGDEEGAIVYAPDVEMVIAGEGMVGMSGGGVFDGSGRLAGVLVRASSKPGVKYLRAVRLSFIAATLAQANARLPNPSAAAVAPYLPSP